LLTSRLMPGKFYALPQAPQQYKQLLQVAGVEKYFQIAKCFRDEDLRADRQPEFTQIDIEASFVTPDDIFKLTEGMLASIFKAARDVDIKTPFDRLTYREAVGRFGSDKPDRRFGIEQVDVSDDFRASGFKVFRGALDAGEVVGRIRLRVAEIQDLLAKGQSGSDWDFLWVTDFPLMQWSAEDNKWNAVHHPFTRPKAEDLSLLEQKKFAETRAEAYDVVLN